MSEEYDGFDFCSIDIGSGQNPLPKIEDSRITAPSVSLSGIIRPNLNGDIFPPIRPVSLSSDLEILPIRVQDWLVQNRIGEPRTDRFNIRRLEPLEISIVSTPADEIAKNYRANEATKINDLERKFNIKRNWRSYARSTWERFRGWFSAN